MLTLSATPIPRTLHLALVNGRDMSVIESPPEERLPVETYVAEYNPGMIKEALEREMRRGGRIYYVHNRVLGLEKYCCRSAQSGAGDQYQDRSRSDVRGYAGRCNDCFL